MQRVCDKAGGRMKLRDIEIIVVSNGFIVKSAVGFGEGLYHGIVGCEGKGVFVFNNEEDLADFIQYNYAKTIKETDVSSSEGVNNESKG